jgi:ABC-type glycerol-3-phosphate transport system substrate-binding protein
LTGDVRPISPGGIVKGTVFSALLLGAGGLLAFGPRPRLEPPPGRVVVTYWEKWTGREGEQIQQIVDAFNDTVGRQKGIYVQLVSISEIHRKTLLATAAGVPPDVAGLWYMQVPQFAAMNALQPLDDWAAGRGITEAYYKPVYWKGCGYDGKLYGLISTPWAVALHYNKEIFEDAAEALRAAGLDPAPPPGTLEQLDRCAQVLDAWKGGRLVRAGYLPMEPPWFVAYTSFWFGGRIFDEHTGRFTLTSDENVRAYEWIRSYAQRLGAGSINELRGAMGKYSSTQNPFVVGQVAMLKQGPWTANFIEKIAPEWNRWRISDAADPRVRKREIASWKARETKLPVEQRRRHYKWGAAPFPAARDDDRDVTFAGFDVLVIPKTARHKKEAFEFIAFVNRQEVMEKLCAMHCKNSPLREVSEAFIRHHPNPYIGEFERMVSSEHARGIPAVPIWIEVEDELKAVAESVYLLRKAPAEALAEAQERLQPKYDRFMARKRSRRAEPP